MRWVLSDHSAFMLYLITLAPFSVSSAMYFANAAGVIGRSYADFADTARSIKRRSQSRVYEYTL